MSKAEETRQFIIEKAAPIFNKHGYEGTSMFLLTSAMGLTKGAIYGHFENKNEIALAAFEYSVSKISDMISKALESHSDSCDKLIAYANFYSDMFYKVAQHGGCPILNAAIDSDNINLPLKKAVIRQIENWICSVVRIINRGIKRGEIRENINPDEFASLFVSLIEGGIMLSKLTDSKIYLKRNVDLLTELIDTKLRI